MFSCLTVDIDHIINLLTYMILCHYESNYYTYDIVVTSYYNI